MRYYLILLSFLLLGFSGRAQNTKGEITLSGGAGYGFISSIFKLANNVKASGPFNGHLEFCLADNASLGAAYSHQTFSYEDEWTRDTLKLQVNVNATRVNYGLRGLYHFPGGNTKSTFYGGVRLGFTVWNYSFDANLQEGQYEKNVPFRLNFPSAQLLVGYRYFFLPFVGLNAEIGVGNAPYFVHAGLTFRFNSSQP